MGIEAIIADFPRVLAIALAPIARVASRRRRAVYAIRSGFVEVPPAGFLAASSGLCLPLSPLPCLLDDPPKPTTAHPPPAREPLISSSPPFVALHKRRQFTLPMYGIYPGGMRARRLGRQRSTDCCDCSPLNTAPLGLLLL